MNDSPQTDAAARLIVIDWILPVIIGFVFLLLVAVTIFAYQDHGRNLTDPLVSGYVIAKHHHDAYTSIVPAGKVMVPIHHPESWTLDIAGKTNRNAARIESISVGPAVWESAEEGMSFVPGNK